MQIQIFQLISNLLEFQPAEYFDSMSRNQSPLRWWKYQLTITVCLRTSLS